ncbi:STE3-domain-containing protein [Zopfia rhizophila CBS 207.26]|uniref:STE3-domain-containing protein n=1 Tax=Zopfia rhizophila CBS 207.26 TaxID=1314779 RepID=A0A6A6DQD5_9PEZI|nr:STE3-domain-containing protein [Zopfia rhizophila CBS 207.26]
MSTDEYTLYLTAIIVPALAFPSVILDIPPLIWHLSQCNVAAWSLMLWIVLVNISNGINALIWPRDNLAEWWDGNGLCDVEARILVGASVALPAAVTLIMRKLARVMDTRNMTITSSRKHRIRESVLEALWCWAMPALMMLVYYVVQPFRYFIFSIGGCQSAFDSSWPSVVLVYMWCPIIMFFAAYYAGLLIYRLYRYRREFSRLIAARDTTKSRFLRLFIMSAMLIVLVLPYSIYVLYFNTNQTVDEYSWSGVHGPGWNSVVKVPMAGQVQYDVWGKIAVGYIAFFVFGTGSDANNLYKKMLCSIGLGKVFPNLYRMSESGSSTPSSVSRRWCSLSSRAKSFFSKNTSVTETLPTASRNESVAVNLHTTSRNESTTEKSSTTSKSNSLYPISTSDPISPHRSPSPSNLSFFQRLFSRRNGSHQPALPLFLKKSVDEVTEAEKSTRSTSPGVYSHAWASESSAQAQARESIGVHVVREVRQDRDAGEEKGNDLL